ncbi:MAG: hypothetical protein M3A44_05345 [Gammaproteobacteria bacterium]
MQAEKGYDLSRHTSESLNAIPAIEYDYVVTMGCGDECPYLLTKHLEDWGLPDPKHLADDGLRKVREQIEAQAIDLIERCRQLEKAGVKRVMQITF